MAKKKTPAPVVEQAPVVIAAPEISLFERMEKEVWELPTPHQQFRAFKEALEYKSDGICVEAIIAEELFLFCRSGREHGLRGDRLFPAFSSLKAFFAEFHRFPSRRHAFDFISNNDPIVVNYISERILKEFELFAVIGEKAK